MMHLVTPRMIPTAPVGSGLREARCAAGLSIDQLAVRAGIGSATVERIEHGRVTPRRATLVVLALALSDRSTTSEDPAWNGAFAQTAGTGGRDAGPA